MLGGISLYQPVLVLPCNADKQSVTLLALPSNLNIGLSTPRFPHRAFDPKICPSGIGHDDLPNGHWTPRSRSLLIVSRVSLCQHVVPLPFKRDVA